MGIFRSIKNAILYVSEGAFRLFSRDQDEYPKTGVQPFKGEPLSEWVADSSDRKSK
ncbi:MAG: nicotinate phosphoribosyltransferase [Drouetiella hepatica Uher 2000/2452]|jgi:hypothetical protein|uniref:Nicotinate phosphoribosyltransferase n=1 Tax=Drouetiella hepatica Uher 2000/2452 TaxID=904376 RepID=A0A951ULR8_9CYAN|nr:nicotinate phosphoribosyltransferase [Drouetiella hepatica Uher 2000/2452]